MLMPPGRVEREPGGDAEAAARPRASLERAAVERYALAHADQPVARPVACAQGATAVVLDQQLQRTRQVADPDGCARRPGVLDRVCEPLLDDPVGGEVDPGREGGPLALQLELDVEAGGAGLLDELLELVEPRLGGQRETFAAGAQDAEQPA